MANYITGSVSNAAPVQISIGSGNGQLFIPSPQTSTVANDRGYIIEADAPIYIFPHPPKTLNAFDLQCLENRREMSSFSFMG